MRFTYRNELSELEALGQNLDAFGEEHDINPGIIHAFNLCLDEILTNIISYGFEKETKHEITLDIQLDGDVVTAIMVDDGKAFNPLTDAPDPDLESDIEERDIGGLGIFFLKQMMDELDYQRIDGQNRLMMKKKAVALPE